MLAGPGLELRADGLLPAEGEAPAFETVYEREGSRVLAHRLRASGFIGPRPERFDLADYEVLVRPGDTLLGFHIPTGPGYDIPTSRASFEAALDLFLKVYPEVPVKGFYCDSWLFSPQLALMIKPADSRIVAIQRELFMLPIHADKEAFGTFLYGLDRLPKPEDLAHDSRLRALVRTWLMEGRYLSVGGAILPLDELARFEQTPYFKQAELDEFAALAQAADA